METRPVALVASHRQPMLYENASIVQSKLPTTVLWLNFYNLELLVALEVDSDFIQFVSGQHF